MKNELKEILDLETRLKNNVISAYEKGDYEKSLCAIDLYGMFMYTLNQKYVDFEIEDILYSISNKINIEDKKVHWQYEGQYEYIIFFDSFGLDLRGLALIYVKALVANNYNVIYITKKKSKNNISNILRELERNKDNKVFYFGNGEIIQEYKKLRDCLKKYNVKSIFLYLMPNDVKGLMLGYYYSGRCTRYFINLTDHAFWIGTNVFDYIIEFRDYGASVSKYYRKIDESKIIKIPYYPLVVKDISFEGFPKEVENKKVVFSGGALYKTIGDENKFYNKIIFHILQKHSDTVFIYAGFGDDTELKKIQMKFEGRVFHLPERKDLYQMMKHSYIYISTYPMIGGLMTQYAVAAETLPLTLLYDECGTGVLLHAEEANLEYIDLNEFLTEVDKCLESTKYLESRKESLSNQLISGEKFNEEIALVLSGKTGTFQIEYKEIDTSRFRGEYLSKMKKTDWYNIVGSLKYWRLIRECGTDWMKGVCMKVRKKYFNI